MWPAALQNPDQAHVRVGSTSAAVAGPTTCPTASAVPQIADPVAAQRESAVRCHFVTHGSHNSTRMLFDYLVGAGEQRVRDGQAKRFCSLHINNQLELRCLIDRNVPRRCAIKDLSNALRRTRPLFHKV